MDVERRKARERERMRLARIANPDRFREYDRRKHEKDRDYSNRRRREKRYREEYGLTMEAYESMHHAQGGVCAICQEKRGSRPLHVDHCHQTGAVRALLCHFCNLTLGNMRESPSLLRAAADYLERHGKS